MVNMVNQLKFSFLNFRSHDVKAALEFIGPHLAGILVSITIIFHYIVLVMVAINKI